MGPRTTTPARPRARRAPHRRTGLVLSCAVLCTLSAVGCSSTATGTGPATSAASGATTTGSGAGPGSGTAPSFASIAALQQALTAKGIQCQLSYPGLKDDTQKKEVSLCTIDNEQAYLTVWLDPSQLTQFLASPDGQSGIVAVGGNWTITVTSNAVARKIAEALGGTVPGRGATPVPQ